MIAIEFKVYGGHLYFLGASEKDILADFKKFGSYESYLIAPVEYLHYVAQKLEENDRQILALAITSVEKGTKSYSVFAKRAKQGSRI